jgi:DNA helicase HerA-like ATPase
VKLKIGTGLALPLEAATETAAILGRRGSGKTHTAVVMAEEMLAAGVQVVILDPLDVWWGLRVAKDGKSAGVAIYVCGGSHADIPLSADAGRILADAVVDRHLSMVLSVRHLSKTDQRRFVGDFCERLYERKADPKHRTALHVFLDEADAFVPQRLVPGSERCFGAVDTMVRRGRSSGLAVTLISQRPQVVNKDVLSQTEVLVAHQLTGPQDRKALQAWIDANDTDGRSDEFMASLASLPRGTAWFWSPGLLKIFARVAVRDRHTFDSSATPKAGVAAVASPKAFARRRPREADRGDRRHDREGEGGRPARAPEADRRAEGRKFEIECKFVKTTGMRQAKGRREAGPQGQPDRRARRGASDGWRRRSTAPPTSSRSRSRACASSSARSPAR